jgi:heme/copper-type cytochrome/quinol oxidase subunit 2
MLWIIIRVVLAVGVFLFGFYMFLDDSRRDMKLTKEQRRYVDRLEIWFFVSIFVIVGLLCGSFNE